MTLAEWHARQRARLLAHYVAGLVTAIELIGPLLDSYTAGQEATELYTDAPAVQEKVREFLTGYRPDSPGMEPYVIGRRPSPEEAARWLQERRNKLAALLTACNPAEKPPT